MLQTISPEEIRVGDSIDTIDDLPELEQELEDLKVEYERENGYPIDLGDEIPDDIEELVNRISKLKKK